MSIVNTGLVTFSIKKYSNIVMGFFSGLGVIFFSMVLVFMAVVFYDRRNKCNGKDLEKIKKILKVN